MKFRDFLAKKIPYLGKLKRFTVALINKVNQKSSYSQHKEDIFLVDYFNQNKLDPKEWTYIDVGANHPSDISNTCLLYNNGLSGIIVEPNKELIKLFKWFRPKDLRLQLGCSNKSSVLQFFVSKTPVVSSFENDWMGSEVYDSYFVPVMRLDEAVANLINKRIFLVSIDVEGLNYEVLEGSQETINKSLFLCIEFDSKDDITRYEKLLGDSFTISKVLGCNAIFKNLKFE